MKRFVMVGVLTAMLGAAAHGQTVIVDEDFEGYTDEASLHAVWVGNPGTGQTQQTVEDSFVLESEAAGIDADFNDDNVVDAADYAVWRKNNGTQAEYDAFKQQFGGPPSGGGAGNKYVRRIIPTGQTVSPAGNLKYVPLLDPNFPDGSIFPSDGAEPIILKADIFTPSAALQRSAVGLRATTAAENLFEMGMYNANGSQAQGTLPNLTGAATNGTNGQVAAFASFGVRTQTFLNQTGKSTIDPDWQFFAFSPTWDSNANGLTSAAEAFSALGITSTGGWHTLEAKFEALPVGGTVVSGDVLITVTIDLLRDGLNNATNSPGVDGTITIDNLRLTQNGFGNLRIGGPSQLSGGVMGFDNIYLSGPLSPPPGGGSAVPEPTTLALVALGLAGFAARRRR